MWGNQINRKNFLLLVVVTIICFAYATLSLSSYLKYTSTSPLMHHEAKKVGDINSSDKLGESLGSDDGEVDNEKNETESMDGPLKGRNDDMEHGKVVQEEQHEEGTGENTIEVDNVGAVHNKHEMNVKGSEEDKDGEDKNEDNGGNVNENDGEITKIKKADNGDDELQASVTFMAPSGLMNDKNDDKNEEGRSKGVGGALNSTRTYPTTLQKPDGITMVRNYEKKLHKKKSNVKSNVLGSPCRGGLHEDNDDNGHDHAHTECSKQHFPLSKRTMGGERQRRNTNTNTNTAPDECWPRLVVIASYPTSGSFIARMLFSLSTGLATGQNGKRNDPTQETIFDFGLTGGKFGIHGQSMCEAKLQLPYAGRVALLKTHAIPEKLGIDYNMYTSNSSSQEEQMKNSMKHEDQTPQQIMPSHIVRLVRNPGDHLLRNACRWGKGRGPQGNGNEDFESFEKRAKEEACEKILKDGSSSGHVEKFINFHKNWNDASKVIPSILLHYEVITNLHVVGNKMKEVIDFVGEEATYPVNYTEVVKTPSYEHGTLFKEMCGIEMARELHELTKEVDELIGYTFDWENGVWNVRMDGQE